MKNLTNIEKLEGKNHYTGYGAGRVWRINKTECGFWKAVTIEGGGSFTLRNLHAVSEHLTKLSAEARI